MYENIINQNAASLLKSDIEKGILPGAVLFSGNASTGKFSAALETARILSCRGPKKGLWTCTCQSCLQHKALVSNNVVIAGPRDCTPEISAASQTFLKALSENAKYLEATRYLFIRSIRKLTSRFSQILWQGHSSMNKIAVLTGEIDEVLETIDFPHSLPESEEVGKTVKKLVELCGKLESDFLYDSIPIDNIRNISAWARLKASEGQKTIIIENADRMLEGVRNALLKILEEPPKDTVFILTTSKRNCVMPTILSRVRNYNFSERTVESQNEVIHRVFHATDFNGTIDNFLLSFLPVSSEKLMMTGNDFFAELACSRIPDVQQVVKDCKDFDPRIMLKLFLNGIINAQSGLRKSAAGTEASFQVVKQIRQCYMNITVYNQTPKAALENLVRELSKINRIYGNIFRCGDL